MKETEKMKIRDKRLAIYLLVLSAFTAACVTLRTVALFMHFNSADGYFTKKGVITAASVVLIVAIAFIISYLVFGNAREKLITDFHTPTTYVPAGLAALSFVFLARELIAGIADSSADAAPARRTIAIIAAIAAIVSVVYFFLNEYLGSRYSEKRAFFGLAPVIFLVLYTLYLYFDVTLPINSPNKLIDQFAFVASALFFCSEVRISLGREKWRFYAVLGFAAALLSAYSSIPSLIIYFATIASDSGAVVISNSISENAVTLSIFIFSALRVAQVIFLKEDKSGSLAEAISGSQQNDTPQEEKEEEEPSDVNQISIDDIIEDEPTKENESENSNEEDPRN